jgi:hypothetical protein
MDVSRVISEVYLFLLVKNKLETASGTAIKKKPLIYEQSFSESF